MLITFKSAASGDVIMFGEVARRMIKIMGKDPSDAKGIVTFAQLPEAIAKLRAAIAEDQANQKAAAQAQTEPGPEESEERETSMAAPVSLAQRAFPLLELLEYSLKEEVPVTWGV